MTGRGDGPGAGAAGGPTRHVPVLLEEVCEALDAKRGGTFIDGTFGAGGYTRAILDANPQNKVVVAIDRDPDAIAGGASLVAKVQEPAHAGAGTLRRSRRDRARAGHRRASTASCSISACRRCSSTRPSAASRSATTARSTCAWSGTARAPPISSTNRAKPNSPTSSIIMARSGAPAPSPARSSRRGAGSRSRPPAARRSRRLAHLAGAGRHSSGDARVPGAAHRRQRRARRTRARAARGRARSAARRAARRRDVPFPRGPDREAVLRRAHRPRAGGSRHLPTDVARRADLRCRSRAGRSWPSDAEIVAQSARALGQAARRRAHRRAGAGAA